MIDAGGIGAGNEEARVTGDDGGDPAGKVVRAVSLVAGDDQQAVVCPGPLNVGIHILLEPGVRVLPEQVIHAGIGRIRGGFIGAVRVVQIIGDDERHGG